MNLLKDLLASVFAETKKQTAPDTSQKPTPIIDEALKKLDERIKRSESQFSEIKSQNSNVIIGVLIAAVLVGTAVAVDVAMFHGNEEADVRNFKEEYFREMETLRQQHEYLKAELQRNDLEFQKKDETIRKLELEILAIKAKLKLP